jgi:predicted PurR-regulated permease PerM
MRIAKPMQETRQEIRQEMRQEKLQQAAAEIAAETQEIGSGVRVDLPPSQGEQDYVLRYATIGIFFILMIGALKISQPIALPVVAGLLLGLVMGPLADRMSNWGVPRALVAALLALIFVASILAIVGALAVPVALLSDQIPAMVNILRSKIAGIFSFLKAIEDTSRVGSAGGAGQIVVSPEAETPWISIALTSSTAAAGFLLSTLTMYFYLATRRQMKARALRLCLGHEARKSAEAFFDRIEDRVASYLGVVTMINIGMGVITGLCAWAGGFSYAVAWVAFGTIMNFIPVVGPLIVTAGLVAAGLMVESAAPALWPAAVYFLFHLVEGQAITPALVGRNLTVSPLLVFLSFAFWLWLWGPVGAILATPILLVIMVAQEVFSEYQSNIAADGAD